MAAAAKRKRQAMELSVLSDVKEPITAIRNYGELAERRSK